MKIHVQDLTKQYGSNGRSVLALRQISFNVAEHEIVCLVGLSGCGKSTLLNLIAGLDRPTAGRILVNGREVTRPGPDRVLMFQDYALFPWLDVQQNVAFGLHGLPPTEVRARIDRYLDLVRLSGFQKSRIHELSGGMQQRVALARALAMNPEVLLMDEPFAALDCQTRNLMQAELLRVWEQEPRTILFVTHNVEEAIFLGDRVLVLSARPGRILETVPVDLPRPRQRTSRAVVEMREHILNVLANEMLRET